MANKEKNFVSAIVYVHNAESRIESFLSTVLEVLETNFEHSEIICVNDKSDDKSVEKIKAVSKKAKASTITLLNLSHYHGLETAMNAGADLAIGDFVFEFDRAVLDFEAQEIMNVYKSCLQGYDIVSASPDKKQRLSSKLFYMTFNKFARLKYEMSTESFRILSRRVLNRISSMNKTVPYRKAIYANCGLKTDHLRYRVCETCGAREEEIISAVGHDYAGRVTRQPTCQHTGEKVYVCAHCGDGITETLAATEHRYEKKVVNKSWLRWLLELLANMFFGYEGEDAYYYQCTVCGKVMTGDEMSVMGVSSAEPHEHRLTDWDVLLPPTCEDGIEVRYCEICGEAIEAVVVPADDTHVFGDWRLAESGTAVERECESCGEVHAQCVDVVRSVG